MPRVPAVERQQIRAHHAVEQIGHPRPELHPKNTRAEPREAIDIGQDKDSQVVHESSQHNRYGGACPLRVYWLFARKVSRTWGAGSESH